MQILLNFLNYVIMLIYCIREKYIIDLLNKIKFATIQYRMKKTLLPDINLWVLNKCT